VDDLTFPVPSDLNTFHQISSGRQNSPAHKSIENETNQQQIDKYSKIQILGPAQELLLLVQLLCFVLTELLTNRTPNSFLEGLNHCLPFHYDHQPEASLQLLGQLTVYYVRLERVVDS
jgi:hypothetical protein